MYVQVQHFKDYIPDAFPGGDNLILDAEVLLVDTKTGNPLPFGTLGVHKVCVYMCVSSTVCLGAYVYFAPCIPLDGPGKFFHCVSNEYSYLNISHTSIYKVYTKVSYSLLKCKKC